MRVSVVLFLTVVLLTLAVTTGKICWKTCPTIRGRVVAADVDGCRRRRGKGGKTPRFRCKGIQGPPCFLRRGKTVAMNLAFETDADLGNSTHEAFWVTPYGMMIPWAGLDKDACKFFVGESCEGPFKREGRRIVKFSYPMEVQRMYPSGYFNLKWVLTAQSGEYKYPVACIRFAIKIV